MTMAPFLARVDYSEVRNTWSVFSYENGRGKRIFVERDADIPPYWVLGLSADKRSLLVVSSPPSGDVVQRLSLSDGSLSDVVLYKENSSMKTRLRGADDSVVASVSNFDIEGAQYTFFDKELESTFRRIQSRLGGARIRPVSWSTDRNRIVVYTEGGFTAGAYYVYDGVRDAVLISIPARSNVPAETVAEVFKVEYKARDGLAIEGIVTVPPGAEMKNLPIVVFPHGGPASADNVSWDWVAQYFANKGYGVFQPNFRGSSGYGYEFENAGYGEWGRGAMQHDITDGVKLLVNAGIADPDRLCIAGMSYGGYAALAGGAFTPDLYKCVVAVAPVSDLQRMIRDERKTVGRNSWVVSYWRDLTKGEGADRRLSDISPSKFADQFKAPVLLLHGDDDTVVPITQSRIMNSALKGAGKTVEFITLKDEDHWLSREQTRIQALQEMGRFIDTHIGDE